MKNLNCLIVDIFDDVNLKNTLTKIAHHIPKDVKSDSLPTFEDRESYDDSSFALSLFTKNASKLNKFPINSKINTALSNEYFELNHHKLPYEAQKTAAYHIKRACEQYDVSPRDSVKIASVKSSPRTNIYFEKGTDIPGGRLEKVANTKSTTFYALTKTASDGTSSQKYPLASGEDINKAITYFDKFASQFTPKERHQFAENVFTRAHELNMDIIPGKLYKYAGVEYNNCLDDYIIVRKRLLEDHPQYVEALSKLASFKETTKPKVFANVLFELDKRAGIDKYYDRTLSDPYWSTFGSGTTKTASLYDKDGLHLDETSLKKALVDKEKTFKNYFGKTLVNGLKKEGASSFTALPKDAKEIIVRIVNGEIQ